MARFLIAATAALVLSSCASTYHEPGVDEVRKADMAILYRDHPLFLGTGNCGAAIDGKDLAPTDTRAELRPGQHRISYICYWRKLSKIAYMSVDVEMIAGHEYKVDADACGLNKCKHPIEYHGPSLAWIEDLTTGEILHVEPGQWHDFTTGEPNLE